VFFFYLGCTNINNKQVFSKVHLTNGEKSDQTSSSLRYNCIEVCRDQSQRDF